VLQFELEQKVEEKKSLWSNLCGCFTSKKKAKNFEENYIEKTVNPHDPIKDEIDQCKKSYDGCPFDAD
jgi:hypothetical protein